MIEDSVPALSPLVTRNAADQVFAGVRVLDLSRWVSGEFCTKHFGDFGADVIKVEKPGEGSLTRRLGPADGIELVWGRPVPSFGEDNEYVYKQLLGYTEGEYQRLLDLGIVSDRQLA